MSQLKNTKVLTTCAMLLALAVILGMFKIPVTNLIEIRFGSLPIALAGSFYGPVIGFIVGALSDILQFIVKPTGPYFPGFTISAALSGLIFGLVLRDKNGKVSLARIIIAEALHTVVISMFVNSLNLYILYGDMATGGVAGYFAYMFTRMPKSLIMFPVNTIILLLVIKPVYIIKNKALSNN